MDVLGIDEAGRGPVIGPMVMAGVVFDSSSLDSLVNLGVKDSKKLSPKKRRFLFDEIIKLAKDYKIIVIPPKEIDNALLDVFMNLNLLEANKTFEIITSLKADKIILDCPSTNPESYLRFISSLFNSEYEFKKIDDKTFEFVIHSVNDINIIAGYKADDRFVEVSAASILAKVTRDAEIEKIKQSIGIDFGSGYPSDPKTREFLKEHWNDYDFFRKTWQSWKRFGQTSLNKYNNI